MGTLDVDVARIVMLHAESGYSDAEIAAMVGGSRSKISMILTRAREKLRTIRRGLALTNKKTGDLPGFFIA